MTVLVKWYLSGYLKIKNKNRNEILICQGSKEHKIEISS